MMNYCHLLASDCDDLPRHPYSTSPLLFSFLTVIVFILPRLLSMYVKTSVWRVCAFSSIPSQRFFSVHTCQSRGLASHHSSSR
ncbi:hypothetical protein GOP47_0028383 [Adiantum capillus-veneris]|nr:hypothetical protein GOP47_0028383 [Adiantum capillus-veneris]